MCENNMNKGQYKVSFQKRTMIFLEEDNVEVIVLRLTIIFIINWQKITHMQREITPLPSIKLGVDHYLQDKSLLILGLTPMNLVLDHTFQISLSLLKVYLFLSQNQKISFCKTIFLLKHELGLTILHKMHVWEVMKLIKQKIGLQ